MIFIARIIGDKPLKNINGEFRQLLDRLVGRHNVWCNGEAYFHGGKSGSLTRLMAGSDRVLSIQGRLYIYRAVPAGGIDRLIYLGLVKFFRPIGDHRSLCR